MNQAETFGEGKWITHGDPNAFPVFKRIFEVKKGLIRADLVILGFATYTFYVNGKPGCDELYLPLTSEYEDKGFPAGEKRNYRAYPSAFDITKLIAQGQNALCVFLGHGWYTADFDGKPFGEYKLCYKLTLQYENGNEYICSSQSDMWRPSYIKENHFYTHECHDYSRWSDSLLLANAENHGWKNAIPSQPVKTEFCFTDCPCDKVREEITPIIIKKDGDTVVYDIGINTSAIPVFQGRGEAFKAVFSEELDENGMPEQRHSHGQYFSATPASYQGEIKPQMMYFGFRYFSVTGNATVKKVLTVCADVKDTSSFWCEDQTLNWFYSAYKNSQLSNLHYGVPSDCPHIEKKGYTGDGQLCCRAAMRILDMRKLYGKWMTDISDCQDKISGRVQNTAPYVPAWGGPGGWGCAIVTVPYEYFKYYGDDSYAYQMYPQMRNYLSYMQSISVNGLVSQIDEVGMCLGDWLTPNDIQLPPALVNTYFYIKSLERVAQLAERFGKTKDALMLKESQNEPKTALKAAYYDPFNGNFVGNIQGANAFALDIGLGDERTKNNFIKHYEETGCYDTGIFGTDIVTRLLFQYGRGDIAIRLMTASQPHGFGFWKNRGATTMWEFWGDISRSRNHPMFGASVAYLFEYILGIRQEKEEFGYKRIIVNPAVPHLISNVQGHITVPLGEICVSIKDGALRVSLPKEIVAEIVFDGPVSVDYK